MIYRSDSWAITARHFIRSMSFAESARPAAPSRSADPTESPRPQLRVCRVDPRDDVCASASDGACVSAMVGLGETYFAAFALALGVGQAVRGLVATIPLI